MILKPSNFISGTTSSLLSSIRSQLPTDLFAIHTHQALDHDKDQTSTGFMFQDGILYHKGHICVSEGATWFRVLQFCHDTPLSGHFSHSKTQDLVCRNF